MAERLITSTTASKPLALLFTSLPFPKDVNQDLMRGGYDVALDGLSLDALESVVLKIVRGTWPETVRFVPRPPELANMVRDEARRIREASAPMISHTPAPVMSALARAKKETSHLQIIAENIDAEVFKAGVAARRWPVGARWKAILQTVFAADPNEKAGKPRVSALLASLRAKVDAERQAASKVFSEAEMTPEREEYWRSIMALKDAPGVTEEQMEFRRSVEASISTPSLNHTGEAA